MALPECHREDDLARRDRWRGLVVRVKVGWIAWASTPENDAVAPPLRACYRGGDERGRHPRRRITKPSCAPVDSHPTGNRSGCHHAILRSIRAITEAEREACRLIELRRFALAIAQWRLASRAPKQYLPLRKMSEQLFSHQR